MEFLPASPYVLGGPVSNAQGLNHWAVVWTGPDGAMHVEFAATVPLLKGDRKSTRLNSSHLGISYAVFCLKKNSTWAGGTWCIIWATIRVRAASSSSRPLLRSRCPADRLPCQRAAYAYHCFFFFNNRPRPPVPLPPPPPGPHQA